MLKWRRTLLEAYWNRWELKVTRAENRSVKLKTQGIGEIVLKANRLRIKLRAYDHRLLDRSASAIVRSVVKTGATVSGPIPLPTKRSIVTVLRSPHVNKKSREQFEMKVHSRLIDIEDPNEETAAALRSQDVPSGVDVEMNEI